MGLFENPLPYDALSTIIFLPLSGALLILLFRGERAARVMALIFSLANLALSLPLLFLFDPSLSGFQFVELREWFPGLGLKYALGIDGISLPLVLLTVLLSPICVLCSWRAIEQRVRAFMFCLLLMETSMIGVFCSLDFVLFYIFWEGMLIPMYLLIAIWGGPRKDYASLKFFIYTLVGSVFLLVAIVALYLKQGTFFIPDLLFKSYDYRFQFWVFLAFAIAFAIKVPMFPFHTWLPAAHVEAPTAGSVFLASILLKMGSYGFLRFCFGLTPEAAQKLAPIIVILSIVAIIYAGFLCLGQQDMKRLIAYSSVAHMGFVTLGLFSFKLWGLKGAMLQMLNHGVTTGALFLCVGILYERTHSRLIADNSGLGKVMPWFVAFFGLFCFSSFGFPGTNNFVGELFVLLGAFETNKVMALFVIPGPILAAAYMLRLLKRTIWKDGETSPLEDLTLREVLYLLPLAVAVIWMGFAPRGILGLMESSLRLYLEAVKGAM
ncbi:MAG: NADH-quinone oxidoreductase subunit M [Deltaproteobacteria bacterium]|nr:MAG: NADH-quinone oxidoreductase subunit M [Deltaproteobacteria bacterium]